MQIEAWGHSDTGQRSHNEDSFLVANQMNLFVVADGVGGSNAGEVASSILVETVQRRFQEVLGSGAAGPQAVRSMLPNILNEASEAIYSRGMEEMVCRGMATTAVVFHVQGHVGVVGHVGDSRMYMVRDGSIYQVTEDHTIFQELLNRGALSDEDAASFPHRNVLSRSVGKSPRANSDVASLELRGGDRFLLCSDGLSDYVGNDDIRRLMLSTSPREACERLVRLASVNRSRDNITAVVVAAKGEPRAGSLPTEQKAALLQGVALFTDLNFQETLRVLTVVREVRFAPGDVIIREGEVGTELFVLLEGEVEVTRDGVFLTRIGQGGHFGELGLIGDGVRSASVHAVTPAVALAISRDEFYQMVAADHALSVKLLWRFLQTMAGRVKELSSSFSKVVRDTLS